MGILHEFKQKSSQVKSRYALLGALVLTLGVGFIWVTTLPARFADIGETVKEVSESQTAGAGFSDMVEKARQQIGTEALDGELAKTIENPTGETYIQVNPMMNAGALKGLDGWENSTTSPQKTEAAPMVSEEIKKNEASSNGAVREGDSPAGASGAVTQESPTPTVILIGTTTSKKSE
jgi:hypothetical protein